MAIIVVSWVVGQLGSTVALDLLRLLQLCTGLAHSTYQQQNIFISTFVWGHKQCEEFCTFLSYAVAVFVVFFSSKVSQRTCWTIHCRVWNFSDISDVTVWLLRRQQWGIFQCWRTEEAVVGRLIKKKPTPMVVMADCNPPVLQSDTFSLFRESCSS